MNDFEIIKRYGPSSRNEVVKALSNLFKPDLTENYLQIVLGLFGGVAIVLAFFDIRMGVVAAAVGVFAIFLPNIAAQLIREEIESGLVKALYEVSRLPAHSKIMDVLEGLAQPARFGPLGAVFSEIRQRFVKASGRKSLEDLMRENVAGLNCRKLERALVMISLGLEHREEVSGLLLKTAEDLEDVEQLMKERMATLTTQKYTMGAAASLIVPFLLGATSRLVFFLQQTTALFVIQQETAIVLGQALLGYVVIQAALAAVWLAIALEGKNSRIAIYVLAFELTAFASFSFGKTLL